MSEKSKTKSAKDRTAFSRGSRATSGTQAQGAAQCHAGRLVWLGHDGAYRLVGRGSDAARRGARYLAGQSPSGKPFLDVDVAGHRPGYRLLECLALGGQGRQGHARGTGEWRIAMNEVLNLVLALVAGRFARCDVLRRPVVDGSQGPFVQTAGAWGSSAACCCERALPWPVSTLWLAGIGRGCWCVSSDL